MKRKWLVLCAIVSMLVFLVAGCAPEAAPPEEKPPVEKPPVEKPAEKIVWKSAVYSPPPPQNLSAIAVKWAFDQVMERSEGRFECQYFWSASLVPVKEQPDAVKSGLCQATYFIAPYYPAKMPLYNISFLPTIFPFGGVNPREEMLKYIEIMYEWVETPLIKDDIAAWNGMPIGECAPACYNIISKVPIRNIEDLKGMKLRASGKPLELLTAIGAVPVVVSMPEIYDSLNKGVVEGSLTSFSQAWSYHFYEAAKYWITGVNWGQPQGLLAMSIRDYEALPDDIKEIFQEMIKEFPAACADIMETGRKESFKVMEEAGLEELEFSAEDSQKLAEISKEVSKAAIDKLEEQGLPGKEAFNSLQDIIAKHVPGYEPSYL